ncbi:MAG: hypothetical protein WD071_00235 [Pseudohongiella sp.]|uniref:hypothetical protein n=1 Tax=Pseudohongiella sp. TaxID=1979412 RepID=UPI0034A053D1
MTNLTFIKKEKTKLDINRQELLNDRELWGSSTKQMIHSYFQQVCKTAKEVEYFFRLGSSINDIDLNEETIQLSAGVNKTGVFVRERNPETRELEIKEAFFEKGCCLVASFGQDGKISFMVSPYESQRHEWSDDYIMLYPPMRPEKVSEKVLRKSVKKFMFYARFTSAWGTRADSLSFSVIMFYWLLLLDIRNQRKLRRKLIEVGYDWSKLVGAGVIGYFVALLTK